MGVAVTGAATVSNRQNLTPFDSGVFDFSPGTYTITATIYTERNLRGEQCNERTFSFTIEDCGSSCNDDDNDGICNEEDCAPNNASFPGTAGTSCDDGDSNTENDRIQADGCSCAGTPIEAPTSACDGRSTGLSLVLSLIHI